MVERKEKMKERRAGFELSGDVRAIDQGLVHGLSELVLKMCSCVNVCIGRWREKTALIAREETPYSKKQK